MLVDGKQLSAPYVIEAIGDPDTLAGGLKILKGFVYEVERVGGTVDIEQLDTVNITSLHESPAPEYAEPVPNQ
ncbi:DUF881 domain-containing protein [Nocardioides mesophilus]|uniref:DUF881 domain-containing protein n=1 Tax=Nocardioides mesophilus TaxID=433659 RepID=A0A7G9RAR8_9ACTN|nr:DUF881 domain-containing protein [Nocardioides mesophilus]